MRHPFRVALLVVFDRNQVQFDLRPGIRLIECQTDHCFIVRAANRSGALPAPSSCEPREEIGQVEIVERELRAAE